jgi:hypothetical protein
VVRIVLIVAVHVILIAALIYIWTKIAYSSKRAWPPKDSVVACAHGLPANNNRNQS